MLDTRAADEAIHLDDVEATAASLVDSVRQTARRFRRTGAVVALSGGIDSSVCLGLAVSALGARRVVALTLPEQDSSSETIGFAQEVADRFGVTLEQRNISGALDALGCYEDRLAVVTRVDPDFDVQQDRFSVEFEPATGDDERLQSFTLKVLRADGSSHSFRLGGRDFLTIMAANNQKQRLRMLATYRVADERNLIVIGTSNRLELDQGFFVKHGDGCGEVFPLRHLLKTQVYDLAEHLGVPDRIRSRPPTTDTFSAPQSQEDYFYGTSVAMGDRLWLAWHQQEDAASVAARLDLEAADVAKFFELYDRRAQYAAYLTETL